MVNGCPETGRPSAICLETLQSSNIEKIYLETDYSRSTSFRYFEMISTCLDG